MTQDIWMGAILGAILGSIVIPFTGLAIKYIINWWVVKKPQNKLLKGITKENEPVNIFIRDLIKPPEEKIYAFNPKTATGGIIPNVNHLWADVDAKGVANVFNVLGQAGKKTNINIVLESQDHNGSWNAHVILIGAQSEKSFSFYESMNNVAYKMDGNHIYDINNEIITREDGFGYGIILKAENPFKTSGMQGVGFLLGGFGVLGTASATYYFRENFKKLGKEFGSDCFGIIIRASMLGGEQAVERLHKYDKRF